MEDCYEEKCVECGECYCDCYPPEGYVKPGNESLLYVNAYEVTRHYGGPQEGGWWYNHSHPLASIPVKAISVEGHGDHCDNCYRVRHNKDKEPSREFCKWSFELHALDSEQVEIFKAHLMDVFGYVNDGNIYSVLGGSELHICVEDHPAEEYPIGRPRYE